MTADIEVIFGLNDELFEKALNRSGRWAEQRLKRLERSFARFDEEVTRKHNAEVAKRQQRLAKGFRMAERAGQVAAVGIAAGAATIGKALQAAARDNDVLAGDLDRLKRSSEGFLSSLGNDLAASDSVSALSDIIDKVDEYRVSISNALGDLFAFERGHSAAVRAAQDNHAQKQREFERASKAQRVDRQLTIDAGGDEGFAAQQQQDLAEFRRSIADLDPATRERLEKRFTDRQRAEAGERTAGNTKSARTQATAAERDRRNKTRRLLDVDARRDPNNFEARREAERARLAEEWLSGGDQTVIAAESAERMRAIDEAERRYNERRTREEKERKQREEHTKRSVELELRHADIQRERLAGRDREADRMQVLLDFETKILAIKQRQGVTEEQRQRLLDSAERSRDAELRALDRDRGTQRARTIADGLGGSRRVLDAVNGTGRTPATDPVVTNGNRTNELLKQVVVLLRNHSPIPTLT
jgi:hypothetical protein